LNGVVNIVIIVSLHIVVPLHLLSALKYSFVYFGLVADLILLDLSHLICKLFGLVFSFTLVNVHGGDAAFDLLKLSSLAHYLLFHDLLF
jgi:hypothetical protein